MNVGIGLTPGTGVRMKMLRYTELVREIVNRLSPEDSWHRNFAEKHLQGCLLHIVRSSNLPTLFRIGRVNKNWHLRGKKQVVTVFDNHGRKFKLISTPTNTSKVKKVFDKA